MGFITRYGSFWGTIPTTSGQIVWVAPAASYTVEGRSYTASDNNDGLSPERAKLTLDGALDVATNFGDVVVLLPGAHSWAASATLDVAGVIITGLPTGNGSFKHTSITTSASDEVLNVTAADVEIAHLRIIAVTAMEAIDFTATADRLYVHDCTFDMYTGAVNTGTIGIGVAGATHTVAADRLRIERNWFETDGAQGPCVSLGASTSFLVADNYFVNTAGALAMAVIIGGVAASGEIVNNKFLTNGSATMTTGIEGTDMTNTGSVNIIGNFFSFAVGCEIDTFGAGEAIIAENYLMNSGAGSGGALITSTT